MDAGRENRPVTGGTYTLAGGLVGAAPAQPQVVKQPLSTAAGLAPSNGGLPAGLNAAALGGTGGPGRATQQQNPSAAAAAAQVAAAQQAAQAPYRHRQRQRRQGNSVSRIWGTETLSMQDMEQPLHVKGEGADDDEAERAFRRLNTERAKKGLAPLPMSARGGSAASGGVSTAPKNASAAADAAAARAYGAGVAGPSSKSVASAAAGTAPAPEYVQQRMPEDHEEDVDVEDELEDIQRFSIYQAALPYGKPHPDPLVEASSLANCTPPPVTYVPRLYSDPQVRAKVIDSGALSCVQLEAVVYACQRHQKLLPDKVSRAGFFVGDGAGVGKGRTIAGIIYENHLHGRTRSLWVSISADLHVDARRDLDDIGATEIPVANLAKMQYTKIKDFDGCLFSTYSSLISKRQRSSGRGGKNLFDTRLEQVIDYLGGPDFDGVIVFDESHKAKNLVPPSKARKSAVDENDVDKPEDLELSRDADAILAMINAAGRGEGGTAALPDVKPPKGATQTGIVIAAIQERMKKARVVYVSATGVSEVRNMAYMSRLGLWGPGSHFPWGFKEFYENVQKRGEGSMEGIAQDLKRMGAYVSRTLSYATASFEAVKIVMDKSILDYDAAAELWVQMKDVCFGWVAQSPGVFKSDKQKGVMTRLYWAAHQRFFRYLCVASKVPAVIEIAQRALAEGKSVVIGLQNTGEANTVKRLQDEPDLEELVSAPKESVVRLLISFFTKCFFSDKPELDEDDFDLDIDFDGMDGQDDDNEDFDSDDDSRSGRSSRSRSSSRAAGQRAKRKILRHKPAASDDSDDDVPKVKKQAKDSDMDTDDYASSDTSSSSRTPQTRRKLTKEQAAAYAKPKVTAEPKAKPEPKVKKETESPALKVKKEPGGREVILLDSDDSEGAKDESSEREESSSSSDGEFRIDEDSDEEMPKKKSGAKGKGKGKEVARPAAKPTNRRKSVKMEDSDSEQEVAASVKSEGSKASRLKRERVGSGDDDDEGSIAGAVRGKKKKMMVMEDSDDEDGGRVHTGRSRNRDEQEEATPARNPANLARYLRPLYRLAGSRDALEGMPQFLELKELLESLEDVNLPDNALDSLVTQLGGPAEVAELTGRKIRAIISPTGRVVFEKRYGPGTGMTLDNMNLVEKQHFMGGKKFISIISDAASAGISLQADRRAENQRRRVHITLELAWSADKTIQQLGRTHRSNQSSAPEYILVISDVAGENRFAAAVAKRMASMGALTKGDRKAQSGGISLGSFNFETRFGKLALERTYSAVFGHRYNGASGSKPLKADVLPDGLNQAQFFHEVDDWVDKLEMVGNEADTGKIQRFLNRLLGMPLHLQNPLFSYLTQNLKFVLVWAKKNNKFDRGVEPVGGLYETLSLAPNKPPRCVYKDPFSGLETTFYEIISDRGISYETAKRILDSTEDPHELDGFYQTKYGDTQYHLAIHVGNGNFKVYKPHIGEIYTHMTIDWLRDRFRKLKPEDVDRKWTERYESATHKCFHRQNNPALEKCATERNEGSCDAGKRLRKHFLFSGNAMAIWKVIEGALLQGGRNSSKLKMVRTSGENDTIKTIGIAVSAYHVQFVLDAFEKQKEKDKIDDSLYNGQGGADDGASVTDDGYGFGGGDDEDEEMMM